ncbi:hypothetical protein D8674_024634 [Pyrus ussuriensis x Pyrus communis]|uniref:Uncharacterized protein n=1 Tax=Pyrus ussuriensis x Pyrus communis TaxID=2448454 RepID=A0A5N5H8J7_9ROSA|nr:hypothetical protein D8674_024634 [Pyrus ussuriensis x Pyrus communis]
MVTSTPCSTYQEFFKVLLWIEDSENAPDDSDEEEEKGNAQKNNTNKNKGQRNPNNSSALLYCRCNNRHFGECRQGGSGRCFTCNQQKPQPSTLPPAIPLQQIQGLSNYTSTGYGGAYHYQGDAIRRMRHIRAVDHNGILEDKPRTLILLITVLVQRGNLINPVRDEVIKEIEIKTGCYLGRESEPIAEERISGLSSSCVAE